MPDDLRDDNGNLTFEPWPIPDRPPRSDLRVAVILDEFSSLAFSYEWHQVAVTPSSWRSELTERPIDLLFVESAWHGNGDAWQYHLTGTSAPRPAFVDLVEWCKDQGIPTVFWNKEDPSHYADFLDAARLFDHVFTTDVNRLDDYVRDLGHDRVGLLPFAAQPAVHNPIRPAKGHQSRDIAFAGMYFAHKYPERREQMDLLLGAALEASPQMEKGLEIFSRYLGADENYQFPSPLDDRVVGSLDYRRMLTAYRAYKVFLNVNSVVDSPSMCARRIFEITASGTPIISTPSTAIGNAFPENEIVQVQERNDAASALRFLVGNAEVRDRLIHKAQRKIWSEHTYAHRAATVLKAAAIEPPKGPDSQPDVTALVSSNRPEQLFHVLQTLSNQKGVNVHLAFLAHGWNVDTVKVCRDAQRVGISVTAVMSEERGVPLGACLNRLIAAAETDVVAKIDDDDYYGQYYLIDQLNAMQYSAAQVVGKHSHYVYLSGANCTVLRFPTREHQYSEFVMGPTIVTSRAFAREIGFPEVGRGEDSGFLERVLQAGGTIYSADRFNFAQMRRGVMSHTWQVSDLDLMASAQFKAPTWVPEIVEV